jgi:hypothetical protein
MQKKTRPVMNPVSTLFVEFIERHADTLLQRETITRPLHLKKSSGAVQQHAKEPARPWMPLWVLPNYLYQYVPNSRRFRTPTTDSFLLTANGIVCFFVTQPLLVFPFIHSVSLRKSILRVANMESRKLLDQQRISGNIEIAGDILCNPKCEKDGSWSVVFAVCVDSTAGTFSSLPSCGRKRKCENEQPAWKSRMIPVGEFHTHPPGNDIHTCKPPSHYDIFQLILACHLQHHNFVITICHEGMYDMSAERSAMVDVMLDVTKYYKSHRLTNAQILKQNQECRMPVVDNVKKLPAELPSLHYVLMGLQDTYYKLLEENNKKPNLIVFINGYLNAARQLGVNIKYHRSQWKPPQLALRGRRGKTSL